MNAKFVQCAAKCCGNKLLDRSDLTFFTFPENDKLAAIWAHNSNLSSYHYDSTLCAEHFEDIYFDIKNGRKVFKENVEPIPTIFSTEVHEETQISERQDDPLTIINTSLEFGNLGSYTDHFMDKTVRPSNYNTERKFPSTNHVSIEFEYCRLCAHLFQNTTLHSIFGEAIDYSELLEMCLPGKVSKTDDISHKICSSCIGKLENCCTILKSFIEADKNLRSIAKPSTSQQCVEISIPSEEVNDVFNMPKKEVIQFQCIMCPSVFNSKEEIMVHASDSHSTSGENQIISNIIKTKAVDMANTHSNPVKQNTTKRFQCIICMAILNTKQAVISHTKTKHKILSSDNIITKIINLGQEKIQLIVKYTCVSCPTIYDSKEDVIKHALLKHPQNKIISKTVLIKKIDSFNKNEITTEESNSQKVNQRNKLFKYSSPDNINKINKYQRRTKKESLKHTETFQLKYRCQSCFILFNNYKDVLDHSELLHPTLKESGLVASLVKVRNSTNTVINDEQNNSEDDQVICVNDGTIIEIDPKIKPEQRKMIMENRYKCLKCFKLLINKKTMLHHLLTFHLTDLNPGFNEIRCKIVKVKRELNSGERYECLICSSHHSSKSSLIYHTRLLHPLINNDKFLCRHITSKNIQAKECLRCNAVFANNNSYRKHMRQHITYTCEKCGLKFNQQSYWKVHLKTHEPPETFVETYKCITCEEVFISKIQLHTHEKIHKIPQDVSCSKCNKPFTSEFELKKHERNIHTPCLCDICGKTYEIKYIRHHLETHNTDKPYNCKLCTKSFKTCGALSKHKKSHFPNQNKRIMCQICGKLFVRESLYLHMKVVHSNEKPWACDICGESFGRKDYLQNHKKTHMKGIIYTCNICHIDLFSKSSYKNHITSLHKGSKEEQLFNKSERGYICRICEKDFKYKINYEDHCRMHAGQKIYSCNVCDKKFGTKIVLLQHKRTHLDYDQLPYQCEICDKKFRRAENLRNHRRVHTGEKPFPCPICQRPFRVRGEMVKHMRIHKRKDETKIKKISTKIVSQTDNSSENDSNSLDGIVNSNMPNLD